MIILGSSRKRLKQRAEARSRVRSAELNLLTIRKRLKSREQKQKRIKTVTL